MYKNILVAIDPSHGDDQKTALRLAQHLSGPANARITALAVVEPLPSMVAAEAPRDLDKRATTYAGERLEAILQDWPAVKQVVRHGRAGSEIVEFALKEGCDCIIVTSHKPGLSDYFLGSTAARVVRHAPCSVMVIR